MRYLIAFLVWLAALPAQALCTGANFIDRLTEAERQQIAQAVAATPYAEGLRFAARRGAQRLTIVGTIHIHDPRLAAIQAAVLPDLAQADLLLVEATPEDAARLEAHLAENPDMMFLTEGPTLPDLLSDKTWDLLSAAARDRQIPPFMAAKMQPWFLSISLALPPCAMADLVAGRQGLDHLLMADAAASGVPIGSLEPWSLVIDLMREGSIEDQVATLELGLLPVDIQNELFVMMMDAYLSGRTGEVWEASRVAINYVPGLDPEAAAPLFAQTEERLLAQRNRDWMPVINTALQDNDDIVIAVGAAHLPGQTGVLQLLENAGWEIRRLDEH